MDTEIIIIIVMAALLLSWVIFCVCMTFRRIYKSALHSSVKVKVKCEECGCIFDVSPKEATHISMTKTKSTAETKIQDAEFSHRTVYHSYAKKFYCPNCKKKTFGQIINLEEFQNSFTAPRKKEITKGVSIMVIGGLAILLLMQIPMHFANKAKEEKVRQMKEQQYEDIKEKYWDK